MSGKIRIKWTEPRIVNLEQLPATLGACSDGASAAGDGTGPPGQLKCKSGGTAGSQCQIGNVAVRKCQNGSAVT